MIGLAGKRQAALEDVGCRYDRARKREARGVTRLHAQLAVGISVVGRDEEAAGGKEITPARQVEIFLGFDFGTIQASVRHVGKRRLEGAALHEGDGIDRLIDILEEAANGQPLVTTEIPFVAGFDVNQLRVGQELVAEAQTVAFGVEIGLRCQFAELRTRNGLRRGKAQLHVFSEVPGDGQRRQPVILVDVGGPIEGRTGVGVEHVSRRHVLLAGFIAHAGDQLHAIGRFDLDLAIAGIHGQAGIIARRYRGNGVEDDAVGIDVVVRQQEIRALLADGTGQRRVGLIAIVKAF